MTLRALWIALFLATGGVVGSAVSFDWSVGHILSDLSLSTPALASVEPARRGQVRIDGAVEGDLQFVAAQIEILNVVSGSLDAHGDQVTIGPNGFIKGNTRIFADLVWIDGRLQSADIEAKEVMINGRMDGNVQVAASHLKFGPNARVNGVVTYVSSEPAEVDDSARIDGSLVRVSRLGRSESSDGGHWGWLVLASGLCAGLVVWRMPDMVEQARVAFDTTVAHSLRDGMLVLIVPPLVILIFAITIFGLPFAVIFGLFYAALLGVALIIAIAVLGDWLMLSFGRPLAHPLGGRLAASLCGTLFLWLMVTLIGEIALVLAAALGLSVIAALIEGVLTPASVQ